MRTVTFRVRKAEKTSNANWASLQELYCPEPTAKSEIILSCFIEDELSVTKDFLEHKVVFKEIRRGEGWPNL